MDVSTLVVLRCCGSDVTAFAAAVARAMRAARPDRKVIVEAAEGDVMWAPPPEAPTIAVRLVLVCGAALDPVRVQPPLTTRPVHLTAVIVAPDGRDPAQPVQAVALPRVFADVVGVEGAARMLHGVIDGDERDEIRDTDEWLVSDGTDDDFGMPDLDDDGTVPPWPSVPEGASGLEEFRGPVHAPRAAGSSPRSPGLSDGVRDAGRQDDPFASRGEEHDTIVQTSPSPVVPRLAPAVPSGGSRPASSDATVIVAAPPMPPAIATPIPAPPAVPLPAAPSPPPRASAKPSRDSARAPVRPEGAQTRRPSPPVGGGPTPPAEAREKSPAAKVAKGLKRIAGKVEGLAAAVVNDWILRAPPDADAPPGVSAPPAEAPLQTAPDPAVTTAPVALGASAPRTTAAGAGFTARFIAHVPGRDRAVAARLAESPAARAHPHAPPCQWARGTAVTVTMRAPGLRVDPPSRTFTWNGEEQVEEFEVAVPAGTPPGTLVLTFDAAIEGVIVATLRIDLVITAEPTALKARTSATTTAARTAFASYASADRARVLERVDAVRTAAGLDVFVDGLSVHPGEGRRTRLEAEIRGRDVFLLFWSASASTSDDVAWEWRTAMAARGPEAVQLHLLDVDVPPPAELADRHASEAPPSVRGAAAPRHGA